MSKLKIAPCHGTIAGVKFEVRRTSANGAEEEAQRRQYQCDQRVNRSKLCDGRVIGKDAPTVHANQVFWTTLGAAIVSCFPILL